MGWFDEECTTAVDEKNVAYKLMTDEIQKTKIRDTPDNSP